MRNALNTKPIRVLLVEDNPGDARLIKEILAGAEGQDFSIEWVTRLADGLERLRQNKVDVVLLDLGLPDSQGLDSFLKAKAQAPRVPFVVLTGLADEDLALTALRQGAQDFLFKDEIHPNLILRAIRYATERKHAELALERERQKLYDVLHSLPAFVHLKGVDLSIRFANRRFKEAFGEPGHKHCYELLRGGSKPCENCSALRVFKSQTPDKVEWHDSLRGRTFEVYNYPFCTDEELLVLTLGIDITERKQAEEAIRDHQEQLTTIYENAPLIMLVVDADRRVRKANKLAEECAGADAADLIGRRGGEALRCLHALDDAEGCGFGPYCQTCEVRRTVIDTLETGQGHQQVEASLPFLIADEPQDLTFLLSTARLAIQGQPHVLITIQDITKRKKIEEALRQSEEHYRSLFDNMLNGFAYCKMLFDNGQPQDFIFLNVNRAFETSTGLQNVVGKRVSEVFPGIRASDPELFELFGRVALTGVPALSETFVKAMAEWFSVSVYSPEKEYFVFVFDIITERKNAEAALRQSEENLRYMATQLLHAQERERLRIAHELHDDLGQSLLLLKLQLSIMCRGLPLEPQKCRQECGASIENVQEIIDSVRLLSHDLIPPTLAEIGLKSAISDLLGEFCHHQGVSCSVDIDDLKGLFPPDMELIIYRIIQESLTNIGKYAEATQVSISLKRKDHQVCLSVEDNGKGFEVEQVLPRRGGKRGLGLSSMEERARMLGGTFHIWSAPDMGTKIKVTIPLRIMNS
jgi:signal transduction histidine kinase/DNA-binding response OmpR family regulator